MLKWLIILLLALGVPAYASEDGETDDALWDVADEAETADAEALGFSFDGAQDFDDMPNIPNDSSSSDDTTANQADTKTSPVSEPKATPQADNEPQEKIFIPMRPEIKMTLPEGAPQAKIQPDTSAQPRPASSETLTEKLKKSNLEKKGSIIEGTWIEKLTELSPAKLMGKGDDEPKDGDDDDIDEDEDAADDGDYDEGSNVSLEKMMSSYRKKSKNGRSNAAVFDIAGVMLKMSVQQVEDVMRNRGFKRINARFQIPNFIKWRNEESCRATGIVGYERNQACVVQKAKKEGFEYIQYLKYAKFDTKEQMEVYFTSNFTDNRVYMIEYRSTIAGITGNSPKATYIRNLKIYDFWRRINRKYGPPDNKEMVTWGLGSSKPFMQASTGYLKLKDAMFLEMDYTKMSREDQKFIQSDFYNF
ncbi:MAG: hypothetical protein IJ184_02790 [Alphaproteobacteria bacterium]|nr:hypothetical protein [Alphaproteobacteria bacterium]